MCSRQLATDEFPTSTRRLANRRGDGEVSWILARNRGHTWKQKREDARNVERGKVLGRRDGLRGRRKTKRLKSFIALLASSSSAPRLPRPPPLASFPVASSPRPRPVPLVRETKISLRSALVLADIRIVSRRPASESADLDCAGTKRNGISGHSMLVYGKLQAISSVAKRHRRRRASSAAPLQLIALATSSAPSASRLFLPSPRDELRLSRAPSTRVVRVHEHLSALGTRDNAAPGSRAVPSNGSSSTAGSGVIAAPRRNQICRQFRAAR